MPAATSAEIAARAALDERYVREWLAVMTTGRIVDHNGATGSFSLPADRAAWLTRAAGMKNLATGMQYIGLMAWWKTRSWSASGTAAAFRTRRSPGFRPSWRRTAAPCTTPP